MNRIVAIVEARMTSSRLPGKVLMPVCGKPILTHLIERVKRIPQITELVIATTWNDTDDPLQLLAKESGVKCFRGSENDVLGRVLGAAKTFDADYIVEITGDCPLIDPVLSEQCISEYFTRSADYGVISARNFPSGIAMQIFPTCILSEVDREFPDDPQAREHVSLPIYSQAERYSIFRMDAIAEYNRPDLRFDLDTQQDFIMLRKIFETLYPVSEQFNLSDVIHLVDNDAELLAMSNGTYSGSD